MGGKAQEGTSEDTVGADGEMSTAEFLRRDRTGGSRMGDNGPHPKTEGGLSGY